MNNKEYLRRWDNENLVNNDKERCFHKSCSECHGTGKKKDGELCIHHISCPCKKCSLYC